MKAQENVQNSIIFTRPSLGSDIKTEILRKTFHFLIALTPTLAKIHLTGAMMLLGLGTAFYAIAEILRLSGKEIFLISRVTALASRPRDSGRFVFGPVTLGLGALIALTFYPNPAASVAIYALAFGDGFASLIGKLFGTLRLPFTGGKTLEGSAACFIATFVSALAVTGSARSAAIIAFVATLVEALPLADLDNIALPATVGFAASLISG
jgi:dolichol kinase